MSLLQNYKNQLQNSLSNDTISRYSSYMDTMVNILLRDNTRYPIVNPENSQVLISYCLNNNARTFERRSYLLVIQAIYFENLAKELNSNIKKLERNIEENLISIDELEKELGVSVETNKDKALTKLKMLKENFVKSKEHLITLNNQKGSIAEKISKISQYSEGLSKQQSKFEQDVISMLEKRRVAILNTIVELYERDQSNHLSGFVFYIKEAYKESLKGIDLESLFENIALCAVETILILPREPDVKVSTVGVISDNWYLRDFLKELIDSEQIFSYLQVDTNNSESLIESFNSFLALIIGIHKTIAIVPAEQQLRIDFVRKMASLKIDMEMMSV